MKVTNEYHIEPLDYCWCVQKKGKVEDKKSKNFGSETSLTIGYFTQFELAIAFILEKRIKKLEAKDLQEFAKCVTDAKEETIEAVKSHKSFPQLKKEIGDVK